MLILTGLDLAHALTVQAESATFVTGKKLQCFTATAVEPRDKAVERQLFETALVCLRRNRVADILITEFHIRQDAGLVFRFALQRELGTAETVRAVVVHASALDRRVRLNHVQRMRCARSAKTVCNVSFSHLGRDHAVINAQRLAQNFAVEIVTFDVFSLEQESQLFTNLILDVRVYLGEVFLKAGLVLTHSTGHNISACQLPFGSRIAYSSTLCS